jgi:hypothetical protein
VLGRVVPQSENPAPSNWHWNFVIAWESVYVKDADWELEGFDGPTEIVGAGGGEAACEIAVTTAETARTPSTARSVVLAVPAVLERLMCPPPGRP